MKAVYFDVETGGLDPLRHPIIQWAGVAMDGSRELAALELKLMFNQHDCDPKALELNSYNKAEWKRAAVHPLEGCKRIQNFLRQHADLELTSKAGRPYRVARLAGHNAAAFDVPFLRALFRQQVEFLPASFHVLDTLQLAMWHFEGREDGPQSLALGSLAAHFGIEVTDAHDALADVRTTAAVAAALLQQLKPAMA